MGKGGQGQDNYNRRFNLNWVMNEDFPHKVTFKIRDGLSIYKGPIAERFMTHLNKKSKKGLCYWSIVNKRKGSRR